MCCETAGWAAATPARGAPPRLPLLALTSLAGSAAVTLLTELLPAGVLPQMSSALQVAPARIGFLASGYAGAAALAAIPFTALGRSLPRRPLVIGLLAVLAVADFAVGGSTRYQLALVVRVLAGLANGMLWSMLASYAADIVPVQQRGRAIAVTLAGITVALCAGVPGAAWLAGRIGWRLAFAGVGALAVLMAACVRCTVPALPGRRRDRRPGPVTVARLPGVRVALATTGLLIAGHQAVYSYIALVARACGISHASLALLVFGCGAVAGIWVTGALIDRHLRPVLLCAIALIITAMLTLARCTGHPIAALCAIGVWGLGFGGAPTLIQTALIDAAGPENAEVVSSLQTSAYNAAIGAGSVLGGVALGVAGAPALPWAAFCLTGAALLTVAAGARHAARRRAELTTASWPVRAGSRRPELDEGSRGDSGARRLPPAPLPGGLHCALRADRSDRRHDAP
jgi:predicted MFS family arabinose efflux permease